MAAVALGISIFGTVINNDDVQTQSATITTVVHQESVDRAEIAMLRAEIHALSAGNSGTP